MRNTPLTSLRRAHGFGQSSAASAAHEAAAAAALLHRRLQEKIDSYEREAKRLTLRGQHDAATVLERAATRLKTIRREEPESVAV
ncbi:MAG: hypothetical protein RIE56_07280 [Amphiplicatus sp.]